MRTLLTTCIIVVITASASAIRCYVCNSHNETDCLNIAPGSRSKFLVDCSEIDDGHDYTLCRKIDMYMDMDFGKNHPAENRIHRACGFEKHEEGKECYYKSGYNTRQWVCACQSDDCNGVSNPIPLLGLLVVPILIGLMSSIGWV